MDKSELIEAGKIINTHGVAGEVKIEVWLDSPEFMKRFKKYYIRDTEYTVETARVHKGFLLAKLKNVSDVNAAMAMKEKVIYVARADAKLPKGKFFLCDIIGAQVFDEAGNTIGILEEIEETPSAPLYIVRGEQEHLIPGVPEFIRSADPEKKTVTVHLIEGM